jgi:hypothetical protein
MIPESYERWRRCITVDCGLELTPEFIDARLAELRDASAHRTRRFVEHYGEAHRTRVIGWFERARGELAQPAADDDGRRRSAETTEAPPSATATPKGR